MHKMCVPMRPQASRLRMCSRPCETDNAGLCSRLLGKLSGILRRKRCERKAYMYSRMKFVIGAQMHARNQSPSATQSGPQSLTHPRGRGCQALSEKPVSPQPSPMKP